LSVSRICLGTMMFGDQTDLTAAGNIVAHAREHGVNFVDTADVYSVGKSETMVGELLKKDRDQWVLATKVGNKMSEKLNESKYSRSWVARECEASLQRLGTDYIDIYYLHRDFNGMDLSEAMRSIEALLRDGIGIVPYSPIARGVLTGKYAPGAKADANTRAGRGDKRIMETEFRAESLAIAQTLKAHCDKKNISLAHFATAWVLANKTVSAVIAGPRTFAQWQDYFGALDVVISTEDEAMLDSLVSPGHPSTPGYNDPVYPLNGRVVGG